MKKNMPIHKNIRNHPYQLEYALFQQQSYKNASNVQQLIPIKATINSHFTWLVFIHSKWVPFASINQYKLEQTLGLGGTFVDIEDGLFPRVKKVRVFPKANYLSYLGIKYRLSRVMQPHELNEFEAIIKEDDLIDDPAINRILLQPPPNFTCNNRLLS
ncbi:uncharacterized protein BX663DRAFT_521646 [Cokeromyces recurvatus]|uniref:uncharacterized protein n=1 Tax=Cokeromyces recurvatus TaxID=90255 RepID=UPI00221F867F|nr:uncharacterized protein BX663DRAFT_521646 [Cokeromyces recurvatus]KAI7899410.1 hypothetical protein BX663DRAFT_521646 [Cokeromyces recurvatus]